MSNVAELTYEIVKRMQADLADVKEEQLSMGLRMAAMEQHMAATKSRLRVSARTLR